MGNGQLRQFKSSVREVTQKHLTYNVGYIGIYLPSTACTKICQVLDLLHKKGEGRVVVVAVFIFVFQISQIPKF